MTEQRAIRDFVERLGAFKTGPASRNFFSTELPANEPRRQNIQRYFEQMMERRTAVLLVGEAPGYRGMTVTGVPFTNKGLISGDDPFGMFGPDNGYSVPPEVLTVPAEPTATVMWNVLADLDFLPLLWSAYPFHPHQPGKPYSNRTPSAPEVKAGTPIWQDLARIFHIESVVAVGNIGHRSLMASGLNVPKIRHPAHGGKELFRQGLQDLLDEGVIRRN
jgi:uracil-DNA glycosylase